MEEEELGLEPFIHQVLPSISKVRIILLISEILKDKSHEMGFLMSLKLCRFVHALIIFKILNDI
jgi:hypothetical protein